MIYFQIDIVNVGHHKTIMSSNIYDLNDIMYFVMKPYYFRNF